MPRKKKHDESFGPRLTRIRKARGLTQVKLAEAAGTTQRAISYYENDAGVPPSSAVISLAKALEVSTDNVLGGTVTRSLDSSPDNSISEELVAVGIDAGFGAIGGAVGAKLGSASSSTGIAQAEKQIVASTAGARRGNFGASRSVSGHQAKIQRLQSRAELVDTTAASVTTNQALPVVREVIEQEIEDDSR